MTLTATDSTITQKTRELCQTILNAPEFQNLRRDIDAFLADSAAQNQYQQLAMKGDALQNKQQMGVPLDGAEITEFESEREALVNNPVARAFLDAQQEMHKLQESVNQYLAKTFELGRVPSDEDFPQGSCGSNCGCGS